MDGPSGVDMKQSPSESAIGIERLLGFSRKGARHPWRVVQLIIVLGCVAVVAWSALTNERFQWDVVAHYFTADVILAGLGRTIVLTVICMVVGSLIGVLVAILRMSDNVIVLTMSWAYIWFFRGTPVLVQLVLWFNLSALYPQIVLKIPFIGSEIVSVQTNQVVTAAVAAFLGLTLNLSAYMAEIVRGGILAVDEGQVEAAASIGMSRLQTMRRVILPQAIRVILPAAGNQLIALLKYTSLVSILAVSDLLYSAQLIYQANFLVIPLLMVATIWYLIVTSVLSVFQYYVERYYAKGGSKPLPPTPLQRMRQMAAPLVASVRRVGSRAQ